MIVGTKRNIQVLRGLSTDRSLLSCTTDGGKVDLWNTDDGSGRQEWDISLVPGFEDIYNIKVNSGTSGGKVFLSCNGDGSRVDLWDKDDGSGRQRWQIVPYNSNIPDYYQIKVIGGVEGGRVFLSCFDHGGGTDLQKTDDGSGRQRWQLQ